MPKLANLRSRLADLRRRRWAVRTGTAWSALAIGVLWTLAAAFVFDFWLEMSRPQRFISLLICGGVVWWAYRRFTQPLLGQVETDLDMALLVERRQQIDSDLVAALQFELPESARWGSGQLKDAVIDYVAEFGNSLNVCEGLSYDQFRRRMITLATTLGVLLVASAIFPGHAKAFLNRFILGSMHYPTKTMFERITINGTAVYPAPFGPPRIRAPYGRPLKFEVAASGELPQQGEVRLTALRSDLETTINVVRSLRDRTADDAKNTSAASVPPNTASSSNATQMFSGELPRLIDAVTYQLFLGDAWTDPALIEVIPLPVVTIELDHTPPVYAAGAKNAAEQQAGARQISVIEGSKVSLKVTCSNKPLKSAKLTIAKKDFPLVAEDSDAKVWTLSGQNTPFTRVVEPMAWEVQVEDMDGLTLEQPLQGYIRIQADRGPRIVAAVVTEKVLPAAKPSISYGATDDYGLATIRLHRQVIRAKGETETLVETILSVPAAKPQATIRANYPFDLKPLKLLKGDEVRVTLEAVDYRGLGSDGKPVAGKSSHSEPLVFQVTDESGILAGLAEADEKSARQLDTIIQRQLGIGESP